MSGKIEYAHKQVVKVLVTEVGRRASRCAGPPLFLLQLADAGTCACPNPHTQLAVRRGVYRYQASARLLAQIGLAFHEVLPVMCMG
jgi:hypothetical protein